jgi:hypothetical protein
MTQHNPFTFPFVQRELAFMQFLPSDRTFDMLQQRPLSWQPQLRTPSDKVQIPAGNVSDLAELIRSILCPRCSSTFEALIFEIARL